MKKVLLGLGLIVGLSTQSYALGGVEISTTPTVSGISDPAQQAKPSADSVYYNPAALPFLERGGYTSFGFGLGFPKNLSKCIDAYNNVKDDGEEGATALIDENLSGEVAIIPNFSFAYTNSKIAFYLGTGFSGQGGAYVFQNTNNITIPQFPTKSVPTGTAFAVATIPVGISFGGSYRIIDQLSLSLGAKYTELQQYFWGSTTDIDFASIISSGSLSSQKLFYESQIKASGIAPEVGLFLQIDKGFSVGIKYLGETKLDREVEVKEADAKIPMNTPITQYLVSTRRDYPAVLSAGTSYALTKKDIFSLGFNRIFESKITADPIYGKYSDTDEVMFGYERKWDSGFGITLGYTIINKGQNEIYPVTLQELDATSIGAGVSYTTKGESKFSLTVAQTSYDSQTSTTEKTISGTVGSQTINYTYDQTYVAERKDVTVGFAWTKKF